MEQLERARGPLFVDPSRRDERAELYAKIVALRVKRAESDAFWADHALSKEP